MSMDAKMSLSNVNAIYIMSLSNMNAIYIILNINLFLTTLNLLFMSTDSIYYHLMLFNCWNILCSCQYVHLYYLCLEMKINWNLKLETRIFILRMRSIGQNGPLRRITVFVVASIVIPGHRHMRTNDFLTRGCWQEKKNMNTVLTSTGALQGGALQRIGGGGKKEEEKKKKVLTSNLGNLHH